MILIVDDHTDALELMQVRFKESAIFTHDPYEAVAIMERNKGIQLLITDFAMPDMDGRQLSQIARKVYGIPSIVITAHVEHIRMLEKYAERVLVKPVNFTALEKTILELLKVEP